MSYNSDPTVATLQSALTQDSNLRQNIVTRYFEQQVAQHNALKKFTSAFDPKSTMGNGVRSIFIEKTDLRAQGGQTVYFNVIGMPGGPGVQGDTELTGNTSTATMGSYPITVDWVRDAFELTLDQVEMLSAGRSTEQTTIDLLAQKMGLQEQNFMFKRLIDGADGNVYRPNNRTSTNALLATDTLSLDLTVNARVRLTTLGAKPLMKSTSKSGCPVDKYLILATQTAMLPIRNDSSFQTAVAQLDTRGNENALVTGEILNWQGNPFYEFPVTDIDWDDFKGGPLIAKAGLSTAFSTATTAASCLLKSSATNVKSRYFQWFDGYQFVHNRVEALPDLSGNEYYAWIINPDGSVGFVAYNGNHNGNQILVTKILSHTGAGTSTKGATTVGELSTNGSTGWTGGVSTLPVSGPNGNWVYTSSFQPGAVILQANAKGVPYSRSFAFGAMAAAYARGRVHMIQIKQERDYEFVHGRGYMSIFGTAVCRNARKKPVGYVLIEHAIEHEGYPVPSKI